MYYWTPSVSVIDEFEKLANRLNPPRVTVDNESNKNVTLIKVDRANKRGSLLQVVQVLNDLNLIIERAYISSDGQWFMDVFHVTDEQGNKVYNDNISEQIQQALERKGNSFLSMEQSVGVQYAAQHSAIELLGRDRSGLLSEVFAVLTNLKCNIVGAQVWTHNSRMASVVYITDRESGLAIDDSARLSNIKQLLLYVLKDSRSWRSTNMAVSVGTAHVQRRLHQMLYTDHDYDNQTVDNDNGISEMLAKPIVTVDNCTEKGYTLVKLICPDQPKLLSDTVCTIMDMQYMIFHGTIVAKGCEALQEYYIRHIDGSLVNLEAERQRVIHCLEAAVKRRESEGIRLELCGEDRAGLFSDVTRIFRENGLLVTRADVSTRDAQAVNIFYVTDASGAHSVNTETIEAIRKEIGLTILRVKEEAHGTIASPKKTGRFSFG